MKALAAILGAVAVCVAVHVHRNRHRYHPGGYVPPYVAPRPSDLQEIENYANRGVK